MYHSWNKMDLQLPKFSSVLSDCKYFQMAFCTVGTNCDGCDDSKSLMVSYCEWAFSNKTVSLLCQWVSQKWRNSILFWLGPPPKSCAWTGSLCNVKNGTDTSPGLATTPQAFEDVHKKASVLAGSWNCIFTGGSSQKAQYVVGDP